MNSELRKDLVSGDWIVIAPRRAEKPEQFIKKIKRVKAPVKNCPFENPQKSGNGSPIISYKGDRKDWFLQIIKNKYPALSYQKSAPKIFKRGPYSIMKGIGHHDIVITRDHNDNFPKLSLKDAVLVFEAIRERYLMLSQNGSYVSYISIFHNWGPKAGASIYHPHYQIIGIPVIPPDINHSLFGSARYFEKHGRCVHCLMIESEKKTKKRIVYENNDAIVFTPFVSREPFELRIFPKKHFPYFEDTPKNSLVGVVDALQKSLLKMEKNLHDPDYNFFVHTSPVSNKNQYNHYHWHLEIQPKISTSAGFELGTGIEITVVDPDVSAKILRL